MNLFTRQQELMHKFADLDFLFVEQVDSTNEKCKKLCRHERCCKRVVIANSQTKGRGRYGRVWESQARNIYISFSIQNQFTHDIIELNFYLGVILYRTLIGVSPSLENRLTLKWPNDVYIDDKKVAGILIENVDNELKWLVVGMGINVLSTPQEIPITATSLHIEGVNTSRFEIIDGLLKNIYQTIPQENYRKLFWKYSAKTQSNLYTYTQQDILYHGYLKKLHEDGSVTICNENGQETHLRA